MRASRPTSPADAALIKEILSEGGPLFTDRQLERWRHRGAIPGHPRPGLGPPKGSESKNYPEGTAEQVIRLDVLLREHRKLERAMLGLFGEGWPIGEEGLREAYEWFFAFAEAGTLKLARKRDAELTAESPPDEIAEAAAAAMVPMLPRARIGRFMAKNVRKLGGREDSVQSVMESAVSNLGSLALSGEPLSGEGFDEAIAAMGYAPSDPDASRVKMLEATSRLLMPALREAVRRATLRELEQSRDVAQWIVAMSAERIPPRGRIDPVSNGIEAGVRMWAFMTPLMPDLAVALHAAALLIFLPLNGETIKEAYAELSKRLGEGVGGISGNS